MAEMSGYCKAYLADELRQFPEFRARVPTPVVPYFFLHDDYVVTAGVHRDEHVAFDEVTDDWKAFCHDVLHFDATVLTRS